MKIFRFALWTAIFVLGAFLSYATLEWTLKGQSDNLVAGTGIADIGGEFTAVRADGTTITQDDIIGRPHVLFFGFTNCPDICPTTLAEAGQWLQSIGSDGDKLDVYFVSVDPERDTPEVLKQYMSAFDKRITAITGSVDQIEKLAKAWRVFVEKDTSGDPEAYNVNHTATTFLMKADGGFFGTIDYAEDAEVAKAKLKRLIKSSS